MSGPQARRRPGPLTPGLQQERRRRGASVRTRGTGARTIRMTMAALITESCRQPCDDAGRGRRGPAARTPRAAAPDGERNEDEARRDHPDDRDERGGDRDEQARCPGGAARGPWRRGQHPARGPGDQRGDDEGGRRAKPARHGTGGHREQPRTRPRSRSWPTGMPLGAGGTGTRSAPRAGRSRAAGSPRPATPGRRGRWRGPRRPRRTAARWPRSRRLPRGSPPGTPPTRPTPRPMRAREPPPSGLAASSLRSAMSAITSSATKSWTPRLAMTRRASDGGSMNCSS